jgi:sec-independent protein translocase protein TatA
MFRSPVVDGIVLLIVVLLIFGPKRLPELGKGLGSGLREFKDSITGGDKDEVPTSEPLDPGEKPAESTASRD